MKRNTIVRIIVYSLLALVLTGILVSGLLTNSVVDIVHGEEIVVDHEAKVDSAPARSIQINWASGNVVVKAEDVDQIIIRETAEKTIKKPMTYSYQNGMLEINHSSQKAFGPFYKPQEKNLVVIVPQNWVCQELSIDGAGLEVTIIELSIYELDVDGAGVVLNVSGSVNTLDIDGAGCEVKLDCTERPQEINLDGAGCVLSLTLPEGCGFRMEADGLGCELETALPFTKQDGIYIAGDGHCQIDVDGLGCEVSIYHAPVN